MSQDDVLKVGDTVLFERSRGYPRPSEWHPQRVREIRIVEVYEDKEGVLVSEVSWRAIREYEVLVWVIGTEYSACNDQLRPLSRANRG